MQLRAVEVGGGRVDVVVRARATRENRVAATTRRLWKLRVIAAARDRAGRRQEEQEPHTVGDEAGNDEQDPAERARARRRSPRGPEAATGAASTAALSRRQAARPSALVSHIPTGQPTRSRITVSRTPMASATLMATNSSAMGQRMRSRRASISCVRLDAPKVSGASESQRGQRRAEQRRVGLGARVDAHPGARPLLPVEQAEVERRPGAARRPPPGPRRGARAASCRRCPARAWRPGSPGRCRRSPGRRRSGHTRPGVRA